MKRSINGWARKASDLLFCPPSGDLEYLTGARRRFPTFGNISYTHGWVCGAFFRPGHDPVFVLPRMVAEFDMPTGIPGEFVVVNETDDGAAVFDRLVNGFGPLGTIAVEQRTWAETLLALARASDAKIVSGVSLTNPMRRIKSPAELERMKVACHIADKAMGVVTDDIADGVAERQLVEEVDSLLHQDGSRGVSFDTAVWAMGPSTTRDASDRVQARACTAAVVCRSTSAPSSTGTARTSGARWRSAIPTTSTSAYTRR